MAAPVTGAVASSTSSTASVWRYFAPRRHGEVRLRQKRVDRRRKSTVSLCRFDEAQGGAAAGGHRHRRRFYSEGQRGASGRQRRLGRKRVVFAHGQLGAPPLMRPAGPDDRRRPDAGLRGKWALPRALATLQRWAAVGLRVILVDECSRPERQRRVRADAIGLRRAGGRSRGFVGPAQPTRITTGRPAVSCSRCRRSSPPDAWQSTGRPRENSGACGSGPSRLARVSFSSSGSKCARRYCCWSSVSRVVPVRRRTPPAGCR